MEKQEASSGAVLVESVRENFKQRIPSRGLRIALIVCVALLVLATLVGIIFGCIAIGTCRAENVPVQAMAQPAENAASRPGVWSDVVALTAPTATPEPIEEAETPEPTAEQAETPTPEPIPESGTDYLNGKQYEKGDSDPLIVKVQTALMELGYMDSDEPTEYFGNHTLDALVTFQRHNDLLPDGILGEATYARLFSSDVVGNVFKPGDSDEMIEQYQRLLIKLGYLDSSHSINGKMDSKTVSAIKTFQDANGLVRDGCLGPATMEQMSSKNAVKYAMRLGMSGSSIKNAQYRLYKLGYIRSSQITGYYGGSTEEAVRAFQKRNGISQSGEIDEKTLDKLNSDKAKAAQNAPKTTPTPKPGTTPKPGNTPTAAPATLKGVEKFIKIAQSKLGCKYVRGAKGPTSFDCSGFVYWCLNQAGVKQSYMTSIAWRSCTRYRRIESMNDIKRGDVLVFRGDSMETGHVGIYLGDGKMIDASSGDGQVRITGKSIFKSKYWLEHFLMAYRIWG